MVLNYKKTDAMLDITDRKLHHVAPHLHGVLEMVYVTEYESVYHTSESCTHLDLSVHRGIKTQVEQKRNEYGGKYHVCERCGGDSALVYYTEKGDCYHSQASCSGLKRTVRLVKKSEIQAYIQCERCRENTG